MIVRWALNIQLSVVRVNVIADIVLCKYIPDRQTVPTLKSMDPRTEPCGTPHRISLRADIVCPIFTLNVRSSKYDLNHSNAVLELPSIGWHLPNADAHSPLLVVRTCYNEQCRQMPHFGGHFNPKSFVAQTLKSCDRQFAKISMLPSGDRNQYFISRVNFLRDEPRDHGVRPFGYTFVRHHVKESDS